MTEPARRVTALGVVVGPVEDAAPGIPFVLAGEVDLIPAPERFKTRRQIDIVGDQQVRPVASRRMKRWWRLPSLSSGRIVSTTPAPRPADCSVCRRRPGRGGHRSAPGGPPLPARLTLLPVPGEGGVAAQDEHQADEEGQPSVHAILRRISSCSRAALAIRYSSL